MPSPPSHGEATTDREEVIGADSMDDPSTTPPPGRRPGGGRWDEHASRDQVPPPPAGGARAEGEQPPHGYPSAPPGYYPYALPGYPPGEEEIDLREYWRVLVRHKRMILATTLAAAVLSAIVSLLLPKTYTATARVLPPQDKSSGLAAALSSQLGGLATLASGALGGSTNADLMVGMLQSRAITDRIIDRFDLLKVYDQELRVAAREKLLDNLNAEVDKKSGILVVSVDDHDPQRAADMTNAFVEELDRLSRHLNLTEASRQRAFLEERLVEVNSDLANAEDALRDFQEKHGAIQMEEQAKSMIDLMGDLKGQLMAAQVQLGVTQRFASAKSPEVDRLRTQINELQARIHNMEQGEGERSAGDVFLPTKAIPDLGLRYARLLRDVKVQETVFQLLTQQYELAKMQEAKDSPTIQILDSAVVPEKKSKPNRRLLVVLATLLALMATSALAVVWSGRAIGHRESAT